MEFKYTPTPWENTGVEPPTELKDTGFVAGYKPPAGYFNWIFNKYTRCIEELQQFVLSCDEGKAEKDHTHDTATSTDNGFLSKEDKIKLDELIENGGGVNDYLDLLNRPNLYKKETGFWCNKGSPLNKQPGDISLGSLVLVKNRDTITDETYVGIDLSRTYPRVDTPSLSISMVGDHVLYECCIGSGEDLDCRAENSIIYGEKNRIEGGRGGGCLCGGYNNYIGNNTPFMIMSGGSNTASGSNSVVSGRNNTVEPGGTINQCLILGDENKINPGSVPAMSLDNSAVLGEANTILGNFSNAVIAGGANKCTNAYSSIIGGSRNEIMGGHSLVCGSLLISMEQTSVLGKRNKAPIAADLYSTVGDLFIVGNGSGPEPARSNALRVAATGDIYGTKAFNATGADYAEQFEWQDGNPENQDRRGLFVTLEGEKIRPATSEDDFILGVTSATPSVVGDNFADDWQGKYKRDIFGEKLTQEEIVPEHTDHAGNLIPEKTIQTWVLTPDFDPEMDNKYIPRDKRKEWAAVGMMGKLVVCDDGTCEINSYCLPGENGVATKSEAGYRVMARLDESHIRILIK